MATINFATREITAKLVYFGATGAGSNTNLKQLHRRVEATRRSRLHRFGPGDTEERSFFFDYVADSSENLNGFAMRFRVYSLPGALRLLAHRKEVLRDLDGLCFVADARHERGPANMDQLLLLEELLGDQGIELATLPLVIQVNQGDREDARNPTDVVHDLNPYGFPVISAVAKEGTGVSETLRELVDAIGARIRDHMAGNEASITVRAIHRVERITDADIIRGHIEAIQEDSPVTPTIETGSLWPTPNPHGPRVSVPFQPTEFIGSQPSRVVSCRVERDAVHVDLVMTVDGTTEQPLTVVLENRPTIPPPGPRDVASATHTDTAGSAARIADFLPDTYEIPEPKGPDLPGWAYGLIGVLGGIAIGVLGVLVFNLSGL